MMRISLRLAAAVTIALAIGLFMAPGAIAEISLKDVPDFVEDVSIGGGTEMYFFPYMKNALGIKDNDYEFVDGVFKLNSTVKFKSNVEFKLGMLYSGTFGEDYYGIGNEDTEDFDADEAYLKFNQMFNWPVDLTLGRQIINVEKGFLMSEGNLDFSTAVYTNAEKASPFAIRADVALGPVAILAYGESIATDPVFQAFGKGDDIEAYGLNVNGTLAEAKNVYAGVVNWQADSTETAGVSTDDYLTYYVGTDLTFGPIHFEAEYAKQTGDNTDTAGVVTDQDASAYFAFLKYTMENVSMMPWIEVGTYSFSGDDPSTADNEGFNTMTLGFPDWGKFSPGELLGEQVYFGVNNNRNYMLQVGLMPMEIMQVRLQYHHMILDDDTGFTDDKLYDEYDLFVEFFPDDKLYFGVMLGVAEPDSAHEQFLGLDPDTAETVYGIMPFVVYYF